MSGRRRRAQQKPMIVIEGRWHDPADVYVAQMGPEALKRVTALPDPEELLKRRPKLDQLALVAVDELCGRRLTAEDLYRRERAGRCDHEPKEGRP
jgi:hypothetical protein